MKETAVEWLEQNIWEHIEYKPATQLRVIREQFRQAKAMEKEQMIGLLQWMNRVTQSNPMRLETDDDDVVEQYYLETYGGNK